MKTRHSFFSRGKTLQFSTVLHSFQIFFQRIARTVRLSFNWKPLLEILVIFLWAFYVGRDVLDMSVYFWPIGNDFTLQILDHFSWEMLPRCGFCMLWNGSVNGGSPAFMSVQGAVLHPVVIITTMIWGAINGAKVTLIFALFLSGLAQWWLAKVMNLGLPARMWAAILAVVGGHLSGRMEIGLSTVILSISSVSLILPPLIDLTINKNRRSVVWLGITMALAILSGQGYMQLAFFFGILPAFILTFLIKTIADKSSKEWQNYVRAVVLAILLSSILLVPTLHFWPEFVKEGDLALASAQPLRYMPLNLVIPELDFFQSDMLDKIAAPFVYMIYIGWLPIILAIISLKLVPRQHYQLLLFFWFSVILIFFISSRELLHFLLPYLPVLTFVRYPSLMTSMAVPLIIALAAWSVDLLLKRSGIKIDLSYHQKPIATIQLTSLSLILLLLLSIKPVYDFSHGWYQVVSFPLPEEILQNLVTDSNEWVSPPYGEAPWPAEMIRQGFKLSGAIRPWWWKTHEIPEPFLESRRYEGMPSDEAIYYNSNIEIFSYPQNKYAAVFQGDRMISSCEAVALGGNIDVYCDVPSSGTLVVKENNFPGWKVWVDGNSQAIGTNKLWLSVKTFPGKHVYSFKYRPWDIWIGIFFFIIGVYLAIRFWKSPNEISK